MTAQATPDGSTRNRLLVAAADCFAANGFHGTSMVDIEKAVGIKRGGLYYHIRSKEELLFEVTVRHVREITEAAKATIAETSDPLTQLREMARHHVSFVGRRRVECIVWLRESHALTGDYAEQVHALREEYEMIVAAVFRRAVRKKQLRSASAVSVKGFLGLIGYSYLWLNPQGALTPEAVADELVDLALYGLMTETAREANPRTGRRTT